MDAKQKQAIRSKNYYLKNKEKMKARSKKQREDDIESYKLYQKIYKQTDKGIKSRRIGHWKSRGVIGDYEVLYQKYLDTDKCENCGVILTYDLKQTPTTKHLDHDHSTGLFRNILCMVCNTHR